MDKPIEQLLDKLRTAYTDRLVSVVLYGSAVTGDRQEGFSDYNVLCVLTQITPRELAAGAGIFRWWREHGNPAPLLLTERELTASADCFAIEFRDIQRQHQILLKPLADFLSAVSMAPSASTNGVCPPTSPSGAIPRRSR